MSIRFTIRGFVREAETGAGVPGLFVKAYDKDLVFDDLLGTAVTGAGGEFEIITEAGDFREFFERRPDLYLRIFARDRATQIWSTEDGVRWRAGRYEEFDVRVPREALGVAIPARELRLIGDDGEARTAFDAGESLVLHVRGLRPLTQHHVTLSDGAGEIFTEQVLTDQTGEITPTVVWPLIGLEDPRGAERLPVEAERARWRGRRLTLKLRDGERIVGASEITIEGSSRPFAVATDAAGLLLGGFEVGDHDARLTLLDLGEWETARVWMVPRRHDWRPGDPITPAQLADGRAAHVDVAPHGNVHRVVVARASELQPGAYDFIVRRLRYGYEDGDDLTLRVGDVVSSRLTTGLVVRERFMPSKVIRGGCVNLQQIAGRYLGTWPYMQYTDTFQVGENIYGALDPAALDPGLITKMLAMYVVPHKTGAQWTMDPGLANLPVLGGNVAVPRWLTQSYCINANLRLLWGNATQVGEYDIVADFGNNTGNAMAFSPDSTFTPPLDIIDGYMVPGFRVVPDPTSDTSFPNVGAFQYNEGTEGFIDVVDDFGNNRHVRLKATVRFPANTAGATSPGQISPVQPNYPLVVIVHGNGVDGGYLGYDYLLDHLARNGFIAASIHLEPDERGTDRARVFRRHLQILFARFGASAANNVGIMGHSRGGEAVVIAARLNQQEAWGYNLNAVISLAPTNQYTFENFGGAWAKPYLVIYGSLDGDLSGISDTGFELYDHASGMKKSMVFVYRSCHDRYNTVWGDGDIPSLHPTDQGRVLSTDSHHKIALSYMSAFFRQHLYGDTRWEGLFRGEWFPTAVQASDGNMKIYVQYEDTAVRTLDNFEGPHTATSWQTSTIGDGVTQTGLPVTPIETDLRTNDPQSPHLTAGLALRWDGTSDVLRFNLPSGQRDVHSFEAVSFRITQRVGSSSNPASMAQDLRLTLTDGGGHQRAIRISKFAEIPFPDVRADGLTKSAMRTVRIPLRAYTIRCLNIEAVDLSDITSVAFEFAEKPMGEIAIDSVQFTA